MPTLPETPSTTDSRPELVAQRVRHPLRFRQLQVSQVERLTPHLVRITLAGDDLDGFVSLGFDDHVKLFFPDPVTGALALPTVGPELFFFRMSCRQPCARSSYSGSPCSARYSSIVCVRGSRCPRQWSSRTMA